MEGLDIKPDGTYVDVTFGGGGHSRELLSRLGPDGRLVALVQTGFEAGMSYIAGHNDGTIQADAGSYRIFGKFLADLCNRMVQIYLHGISLTGIAQLCWYQTGRIVIHFLNPDTFLVDFSLDVTVG